MKTMFSKFDKNGDGAINQEELKDAFAQIGNNFLRVSADDAEIKRIVTSFGISYTLLDVLSYNYSDFQLFMKECLKRLKECLNIYMFEFSYLDEKIRHRW